MIKLTFIESSGTRHEIEVSPDQTLAQAALENGIPGIDADCGGNCACGTCHVFVPENWQDLIEDKSETEEAMLEFIPDVQPNSRLSCQIPIGEEMDGSEVQLPEFQM